jgi:uncharacterized protein (DUF1330 family)
MAAYVISEVTPRNPDALSTYRERAERSIEQYGGRYIVRGGPVVVLEGEFRRQMIVVVEFPDGQTARRWYRSPEYAKALAVRNEALVRDLLLVDGIPSAG